MKPTLAPVLLAVVGISVAGCGSSAGSGGASVPNLAVVRAALRDAPSVGFNGCLIPVGRPTWANILLSGAKGRFRGPFRAVWSIDGKVDTSDPQRAIAVPGEGTRLELLVRLHRTGQKFHVAVSNAHGVVGGYSFTNTAPGPMCNRDGRPAPSNP